MKKWVPLIVFLMLSAAPSHAQNVGGANPSGSLNLPGGLTIPTRTTGDNTTNAASTAFVTTAIANAVAGVNPAVAVQAATAAILPNSPTYNNGVAGVGATITTLTLNTPLVVDGYTPVLNDRILVKNEAGGGGLGASRNGVYFVSQVSGVGLAWVLTRALDYDAPSDINNTGAIPVINGTVNATTQWVLTSQVTTVGTDALTYAQFSANPGTTCTNQFLTSLSGTCTTPTIASAQFANQGTATTVLHGNAGGNPSFGKVSLTADVSGVTPQANGGTGTANTINFFQTEELSWAQSGAAAITTNNIRLVSFFVSSTITASTIGYDVLTADNTANNYDFGAYGPGCFNGTASIALAYHTGTLAGTVLAPATGFRTQPISGAPVTLQPGWYCLAFTSSGGTPALVLAGSTSSVFVLPFTATTTTGGGATLPSTITAPALSFGLNGEVGLALW